MDLETLNGKAQLLFDEEQAKVDVKISDIHVCDQYSCFLTVVLEDGFGYMCLGY